MEPDVMVESENLCCLGCKQEKIVKQGISFGEELEMYMGGRFAL